MIQYMAFGLLLLAIVVFLWLLQPYRNWKKNFDNRKYEPILITDLEGKTYTIDEYRSATSNAKVELSLVVPSYNEEKRLPLMLIDAAKYLKQGPIAHQIIVVNDGSKDKTTAVALEQAKQLQLDLVVVEYPRNRGKGGAVRAGMAIAHGDYVLMVDADGATTFSELAKVMKKLKQISEKNQNPLVMVVGSRRHLEQEAKIQRKFHRKVMSAVFKLVISVLIGTKTKDTQCGFKLFTRESAKMLFEALHIERFAFDVELFYLSIRYGIETAEVGVQWHDVDDSKLNLLDASVNMFRDVLMIRVLYTLRVWKTNDKVQVK